MTTGGCLCGRVRYRLAAAPREVYLCHCGQCQKAQGGAFAASVPVAAASFELSAGAEYLKAYRSSPAKARYFCAECGSPLYSQTDGKNVLRLRAGSLDPPVELTIKAHIYTAGRAPWDEIHDSHPQFEGQEPGRA